MGEKRGGSSGFGRGERKNARRRKGRPLQLQLEGGERERVSESGRSLVVEWKSGLDDDFNFIVRH